MTRPTGASSWAPGDGYAGPAAAVTARPEPTAPTPPVRSWSLPGGGNIEDLQVGPQGTVTATIEDSQRTEAFVLGPEGAPLARYRMDRGPENHFFYSALASRDGRTMVVSDAVERRLVGVREGQEAWSRSTGQDSGNLHQVAELPGGDFVLVGSHYAMRLSSQGEPRWSYISPRLAAHSGHDGVAASDGTVYLAGIEGIEGVREGRPGWHCPPPDHHVFSQLTLDPRGPLLASAFDGRGQGGCVMALDPSTGSVKWSFPCGFNRAMKPAASTDGQVYAVDQEARLVALDPEGRLRWSKDLADPALGAEESLGMLLKPGATVRPQGFPTSPALDAQGNVYVGWGRDLYCFRPDGRLAGSIELPAAQPGCQVPCLAADGTLYVHDGGSQVMALDTKSLFALSSSCSQAFGRAVRVQVGPEAVTIGSVRIPVRRRPGADGQ